MPFSELSSGPIAWARKSLFHSIFVVAILIMGSLLVTGEAQAQACGSAGQRACCLSEAAFGACDFNLIKVPYPNAGQCSNWPAGTQAQDICVAKTSCGSNGERACCASEGLGPACDAGLVEQPYANAGYCTDSTTGAQSSGICRASAPCGGNNQRACCLGEGTTCDAGLTEFPQANSGQCSNQIWGIQSSGICKAVTACGGTNQRACCSGEGQACNAGLVEQPQANSGQCGGGNLPGIESSSICRATATCGGAGQRACCAGEETFGACESGLVEVPQANSGQCSNLIWGIQSDGICEAITSCGGPNERACCSGEGQTCDAGLVEQPQANSGQCSNQLPGIESSGICRTTQACGGDGQRACCSGEGAGACQGGLVEVPQPNSGQCSNQIWGIQSDGICNAATSCGGPNERACCAGEGQTCDAGLVEQPQANSGQCSNQLPGIESSGICRATTTCGGDGQRACCPGEGAARGIDTCYGTLVEFPQENSGQCSNLIWGIQSSGICFEVTPCGGINQRACCAGEGQTCNAGLVEQPRANAGQCGGGNLPGIESSSMCRATTACGQDGQRACCAGEETFGACEEGFLEVEEQVSGAQCSNLAWGTLSTSSCLAVTACGGPGQRACCVAESDQACQMGVTEVAGCAGDCICDTGQTSNATCITASSCGGPGQRACCAGEESFGACRPPASGQVAAIEIPGCSGDCFCGAGSSDIAVLSSSTCGVIADSEGKMLQIEEPTVDCVDCEPEYQASECSLRGVADMHTHMFADLGHGGGGFVGKPYDADGGVNEALKQDYGTDLNLISAFKGGLPLPQVDNGVGTECPGWLKDTGVCAGQRLWHGEHGTLDDPTGTGSNDKPKAPLGSPVFNGWPTWTTTVHQQMYYKWIERAYRGGLRLMVMHAVHSEAFCEVSVQLDGVDCADSMAQIDLQLQAAYDFQAWLDSKSGGPGEGWFRIVKTPAEARQVVLQGKLAVTLGIEVDNIFNCKATGPCPNMPNRPELDTLQKAVDFYYDIGVRHIFPVHNFDNAFAGTATWLDPLAAGNRFVEQQWIEAKDCADTPDGETGYGFRHSTNSVNFLLSLACSVSNETTGKCVNGSGGFPPPYETQTSCNVRGLSAEGVELMNILMAKGMLIDIDHMSNESLEGTLQMAEANKPNPYPLVASHGLFFDLHEQLFGDASEPVAGTGQDGRHERLRTRAQLERLRDVGSLIAVMTMDNAQIGDNFRKKNTVAYTPAPDAGLIFTPITDDCRHSTKTWAQSYQYAVDIMGGPVALGTDFNGVASHLGPRFGADGCGGESGTIALGEGRLLERSAQERSKSQLTYPFTTEFGTFDRQVTGQKAFDFNVDGLAHIGLLPDMIADLKKVGLSDGHLEPLYNSANKYIEVWEGARNERCGVPPMIFRDSFETSAP